MLLFFQISGNSPVHIAVRGRHRENVRQLISKQGRYDILNAGGKSPLSLAKDKEMKNILLHKDISDTLSPMSTPSVKKVKSVPASPALPTGPIVLPGNEKLQSPSILKRKRHIRINGENDRKTTRLSFSNVVDYSGVEPVEPAAKRQCMRAAPMYTDFSSDEEGNWFNLYD